MAIDKIVMISLPVSDQDRAKSFYTDKLGLLITADYVMGNAEAGELAIAGSRLRLREEAQPSHSLPGLKICSQEL